MVKINFSLEEIEIMIEELETYLECIHFGTVICDDLCDCSSDHFDILEEEIENLKTRQALLKKLKNTEISIHEAQKALAETIGALQEG